VLNSDTHPLDVYERTVIAIYKLSGKFGAFVGVGTHDVLQQTDKVRSVANLLGVEDDLVRLAGLSKACNDLVGNVCAEIDTKCKGHVVEANDIAKLLATSQL
jgi:hypothetical protein